METLIGKKFGRLTVKAFAGHRLLSGMNRAQWLCVCDCGKEVTRFQQQLKQKTKGLHSCGCYLAELRDSGNLRRRHSHAVGVCTKTYRSWQSMKARCYKDYDINYKNYGGRGIRVCDRWQVFENFLADLGECPPGYTIERKDVNGNYEPANCLWIPRFEQGRNMRRTHIVMYEGKEWSVTELAKALGMKRRTVQSWVQKGKLPSRKIGDIANTDVRKLIEEVQGS